MYNMFSVVFCSNLVANEMCLFYLFLCFKESILQLTLASDLADQLCDITSLK